MNVKTVYCSDDATHATEMVAYHNTSNQIFISVHDPDDDTGYYSQFITLDKKTAIRLAKDLRREISYLEG